MSKLEYNDDYISSVLRSFNKSTTDIKDVWIAHFSCLAIPLEKSYKTAWYKEENSKGACPKKNDLIEIQSERNPQDCSFHSFYSALLSQCSMIRLFDKISSDNFFENSLKSFSDRRSLERFPAQNSSQLQQKCISLRNLAMSQPRATVSNELNVFFSNNYFPDNHTYKHTKTSLSTSAQNSFQYSHLPEFCVSTPHISNNDISKNLLKGCSHLSRHPNFELSAESPRIVNVWAHNLEIEFSRIRHIVERFQYIAMDTEFPGIVARPTENCRDYNYKIIKFNVDLLNIIQLGITFADEMGASPPGTSTWQFNFQFDLSRDMYAQDSIDFLRESGIDFTTHQNGGIDIHQFGELIIASGLVMNKKVKWISFHGCYDFAYLLKILTCAPLPESEALFLELLHDFFPSLYDIKYILMSDNIIKLPGSLSLQNVAKYFEVKRIGEQHQAGSDSLVTCQTFFRLMDCYFGNLMDDTLFSGLIYGLGSSGSSGEFNSQNIHSTSFQKYITQKNNSLIWSTSTLSHGYNSPFSSHTLIDQFQVRHGAYSWRDSGLYLVNGAIKKRPFYPSTYNCTKQSRFPRCHNSQKVEIGCSCTKPSIVYSRGSTSPHRITSPYLRFLPHVKISSYEKRLRNISLRHIL